MSVYCTLHSEIVVLNTETGLCRDRHAHINTVAHLGFYPISRPQHIWLYDSKRQHNDGQMEGSEQLPTLPLFLEFKEDNNITFNPVFVNSFTDEKT